MKRVLQSIPLVLLFASAVTAAAVVDERLAEYQSQGAGPFSASAGEALWSKKVTRAGTGEARSCTTCHSADLRSPGKHAETGKSIEPLAPAVNPERLSDARQIEKWFLRNCKWTFGRECTPQEKGDFLMFIQN
jgi:hypothetical protein